MGTASPLVVLGLAALLVLPGLRQPQGRGWVLLFLSTLVLLLGLQALPALWPGRAGLPWREMGFTWAQQRGSLRSAFWVSTAALSLNVLAMHSSSFRLPGVPAETWAYQATLPGLLEEVAFRGVLLALLDRAFRSRRAALGVHAGWGAVVVTLVFVGLHGWSVGVLLGVLPASLLYLWLRLRTGSLVLPVVVHNAWNLSVYAAHL